MEKITLSAQPRKIVGRKVKQLRKQGFIPAVLYGSKTQNINLMVREKDFLKVFKQAGESTLIYLKLDKKEIPVLIHEIQKDPISGKIIHADFYQPELTKEVEAWVPIKIVGEAPAVKKGGILVKAVDEVLVKALPEKLPHEIEINVDKLEEIGDEILVKDIQTQDFTIVKDPNDVLVTVVKPEEEKEEEERKPEEVEVITEKKEEKEQSSE